MSRILIVYSTRAGTTAHVANLLAKELRLLRHDVSVASASAQPSPGDAELFVVGSGILAGKWNKEAIDWLRAHKSTLEGRTALFNVCLSASDPESFDEALGYNDEPKDIVEPILATAFPGRYRPDRVKWWERMVLRMMGQGVQDHLDPVAIAKWAQELDALQMAK